MADSIADKGIGVWNVTGKPVMDGLGVGMMHTIDSVAGMGVPGTLWNERDAYRNEYTSGMRNGAQAGDVIGFMLPLGYGISVIRGGGNVLGMKGKSGVAARMVLGSVLLGGAFASGRKVVEHAVDEGNITGSAATAAAIGGLMLGHRVTRNVPMKLARVTTGLAGAAGIGAGVAIGRSTSHLFGDGHINEAREKGPERSGLGHDQLGWSRAAWANFVEDGPPSLGVIQMAHKWDRRGATQERYTDSQVKGAIVGDAAGLGLSGMLAYGIGRSLVGAKSDRLSRSLPTRIAILTSLPARMVADLLNVGEVDEILDGNTVVKTRQIGKKAIKNQTIGSVLHHGVVEHLTGQKPLPFKLTPRLARIGAWGAAGVLLGYNVLQSHGRGKNNPDSLLGGWQSAAVSTAAAVAGTALVLGKAPALAKVQANTKIPIALITSAGLVGLTGFVRAPAEGLVADISELQRRNDERRSQATR